jgi:hypothetical protein
MSEAVKQEVAKLRGLGFNPYLHGSRSKLSSYSFSEMFDWFAPPYPSIEMENKADWDYAIQFTNESSAYFHGPDSGYSSKDELWYQDNNTVHVFEKVLEDGSVVQVSLRSNLQIFKTVWQSIDEYFYYDYLWKRGPSKPNGDFIAGYLNSMYTLAGTLLSKDILWD